jgi:hypothetical protein
MVNKDVVLAEAVAEDVAVAAIAVGCDIGYGGDYG